MDNNNIQVATIGGGCFWCVEAVMQRLDGVLKIESGYAGGNIKNPTYKDICTGTTGHAEVAQITFDANVISYADLLYVFFRTHDPTTLNRQGNDRGTQYRSVVFYHNDEQKAIAEQVFAETDAAKVWQDPLVTEISPLGDNYYSAEGYHQNYYNNNRRQPYCVFVIDPKVKKLKKEFKDKLKV